MAKLIKKSAPQEDASEYTVGKLYSLDDRDHAIKFKLVSLDLREIEDADDVLEATLVNEKSIARLTVAASRLRP